MRLAVYALSLVIASLFPAEVGRAATIELPIKYREGLLWVEVKVPQSDKPLNFLLDTGASASVLNLNTAERLGLKLGAKVNVSGVQANLSGYWPVKLSAKADKVALSTKYLALDLSKLSGACSNSVDGLIGADFFCDRVVQIDYDAQKLRVLDSPPPAPHEGVVPLENRRCGLRVSLTVNNGKPQWMRLDTGCATALHWVTGDVDSSRCSTRIAVGLSQVSIPQTTTTISFGSVRIDEVQTGLHRAEIFPGECGLVGNELLARFGVITIDAKSHRLLIGGVHTY